MSKKLIIVSILLGATLVSLLGYYFLLQTNPEAATNITSGFKNFFPFGGGDTPEPGTFIGGGEEIPPEIPAPVADFDVKLRKLSPRRK